MRRHRVKTVIYKLGGKQILPSSPSQGANLAHTWILDFQSPEQTQNISVVYTT